MSQQIFNLAATLGMFSMAAAMFSLKKEYEEFRRDIVKIVGGLGILVKKQCPWHVNHSHRKSEKSGGGKRQMKEYRYCADVGSLVLGNLDFISGYSNGFGDGYFRVIVLDSRNELKYIPNYQDYRFETTVFGKFNVYDYDCLQTKEDLSDPEHILTTLEGRYAVFCNKGDMIMEKWK